MGSPACAKPGNQSGSQSLGKSTAVMHHALQALHSHAYRHCVLLKVVCMKCDAELEDASVLDFLGRANCSLLTATPTLNACRWL